MEKETTMNHEILIINTGGTFNKCYNPLTGRLDIDTQGEALQTIASKWLCHLEAINTIGKDSLEMTQSDREALAELIEQHPQKKILIIHGTDTIDLTASYLATHLSPRSIVLTGAMQPFSIDPLEATANFALAYGYLLGDPKCGLFIAMHGLIKPHDAIKKDRHLGKFVPID
jgi:L-asparaginase